MKLDATKIRVYMARKALTGLDLATAAGISRQTVSMILHGKDCTEATAGKIAKALNLDPTDLIAD